MIRFFNEIRLSKQTQSRARTGRLVLSLLLMLSLFLTACFNTTKKETPTTPTQPSTEPGLRPGQTEDSMPDKLAFIISSSIESKSGKEAYEGMKLIAETNADCRYVENVLPSAVNTIVERLILSGYRIFFFDSEIYSEVVANLAPHYPEALFFVFDSGADSTGDNYYSISFRNDEQAFLLGAVSAVLSDEKEVALISQDPGDSFTAGVKFVNPAAVVHSVTLEEEQSNASTQTEDLIENYNNISVMAVMAGEASKSVMQIARDANISIVTAEDGIKLARFVETPDSDENETDETDLPENGEDTTTTKVQETAPTATSSPDWSPDATQAPEPDEELLYNPALIKVLSKKAESYLYVYDLFRQNKLPDTDISCGVSEGLIVLEDISAELSEEKLNAINDIVALIRSGDISVSD